MARLVARVALGVAVALIAALHVLRRDLSPLSDRLSEYAVGPLAALLALTLVCVAIGLVALGTVEIAAGRWAVAALFAAAAAGLVVSAAFPTEPDGSRTTTEVVHSAASAGATFALLAAAGLRSVFPAVVRRRLDGEVVLAGAAILLGAVSPLLHDSRWTGVSQRLLWAVLLAWLLVVSRRPAPPLR